MEKGESEIKTDEPAKAGHPFLWFYLAVILMALVGGGIYAWQHQKVLDLQKHLILNKRFTSIEDCRANGGLEATTVNGQFDACVGRGDDIENIDGGKPAPGADVFLQYSAQNLPRVDEHFASTKVAKSHVVHSGSMPAALISTLETKENDGCGGGEISYFKILKVVEDRYALLNYGCDSDSQKNKDSTYIYAMNIGGDWRLLSPTNNIDRQGRPSCLLQDIFKISSKLAPQCFENTGYGNGDLKNRNYP